MKEKKWLKITAVFFAFIIAFTIFSRAASDASAAKVSVDVPSDRTITHEVHLSGNIEAEDYFLQYVEGGLMVKSISVSEGEHVDTGDVLFSVDEEMLAELIENTQKEISNQEERAQNSVTRAKDSYDNAVAEQGEETTAAYNAYLKAVDAYNAYIANWTAEQQQQASIPVTSENNSTQQELSAEEEEEKNDTTAGTVTSNYNQEGADALHDAMEAAYDNYETVERTENRAVDTAADALNASRKDAALDYDTEDNEKLLEKLQTIAENGGEYKSEYSGVVTSVSIQPGIETTKGVAVMIADTTENVLLRADLSEEYKNTLTADSVITVEGKNQEGQAVDYTGSNASVMEKSVEGSAESSVYSMSMKLPGNLFTVGSIVSITIQNESEHYSCCIPINCLRQEGQNEYFVYYTDVEDTVLGETLVAKKMSVTVLDKNEKYVAIEESLSDGQQLIAESDKDISDGSRIKIVE